MIKKIVVHAHVRDCFYALLYDENAKLAYVPSWMAGKDGSDDFILEIDNETGQILNWKQIPESVIEKEEEID